MKKIIETVLFVVFALSVITMTAGLLSHDFWLFWVSFYTFAVDMGVVIALYKWLRSSHTPVQHYYVEDRSDEHYLEMWDNMNDDPITNPYVD
jgi:hypothetical protein